MSIDKNQSYAFIDTFQNIGLIMIYYRSNDNDDFYFQLLILYYHIMILQY